MPATRRTLLGLVPPAVIGPILGAHPDSHGIFALGQGPDDAPGATILDVIPATTRERDVQYGIVVELTDIAREIDHTGIPRPASLAEGEPDREAFLALLAAVTPSGGTFVQIALAPDWRDLHGFDILEVDQFAVYGLPPDRATVLQGRFDLDAIRDALADQGYEAIDVDGVAVMTLVKGDALGLDNPVNRIWVGGARNVALVDDARLVFSASIDLVEEVVRTIAGEEVSLASDDDMLAVFPTTAEPFTSAVVVDGRGLAADRFPVSDGADAPLLPRVELAVFGATPGAISRESDDPTGPSADYAIGENQVRVLFTDRDAAADGREVIEARLATGSSVRAGERWSDLFGQTVVEQVADSPLVIVHLAEWLPGQRRATDLVYGGDMGCVLWG